jgi:nicotinamide riboside kinase
MNPDNLVPRVANLENLMQYMAETQRQLAATNQRQEDEIKLLRQMLQKHDETIVVMQGQIGLLLQKLLGNS